MPHLVDSNLFVRLANREDPDHETARRALRDLYEAGHPRYFGAQNMIEFWSVATRPSTSRGGLGLTVVEADRLVRIYRRSFTLLPEIAAVFEEWHRLVVKHGVSGVQVHDARIAASMNVHGITHILTFNTTDFDHCGVVAVSPASLL